MKSAYMIVFAFDVIAKLLTAFSTILIIRLLTVSEYAVFTIFHTISTLAVSIIGTGLSVAYVRFAAEKVSRGDENSIRLFQTCSLLIGGVTLLSLVLIPFLNSWFEISSFVSGISLIYGGLLALNKMNQSYFQVDERYSISGIVTNLKNISLCIFVTFLFVSFKKVTDIHIIIVSALSSLLAYLLGYYWIIKGNHERIYGHNNVLFKSLLKESSWLIVYFLLIALFDQGCIIIMSRISSETDIATYGVASKYYALMLTFLTSLFTVLRIKTSNKDIVDSAHNRIIFVKQWIRKVWWVAGIICTLGIAVSGYVLPWFNGNDYSKVVPTFNILMVGVFISYLFAPNVAVMMSAKRHKELCILASLCFVVNCLVCYLTIPQFGAIGAALAVVLSNAMLNIMCTIIIINDKK